MIFQRKTTTVILAIIMIFSVLFSPASYALEAQPGNGTCTSCNGKGKSDYKPASAEQENKMVGIIQKEANATTPKFSAKSLTNTNETTREVLIVKDTPDLGFVLEKNTVKRTLSIYGVDLTAGVIFAHADFSFTTDVNGNQIFTISSSQKVQQFKITTDGRLIDLMTNKEVDINTVEFTQLAGVQDQKSTSTITSLASCREYVGTMCGLMSGYGMAELCALAALAGGLPGLGCAIIYAAIATWGCSSAMDLFC